MWHGDTLGTLVAKCSAPCRFPPLLRCQIARSTRALARVCIVTSTARTGHGPGFTAYRRARRGLDACNAMLGDCCDTRLLSPRYAARRTASAAREGVASDCRPARAPSATRLLSRQSRYGCNDESAGDHDGPLGFVLAGFH